MNFTLHSRVDFRRFSAFFRFLISVVVGAAAASAAPERWAKDIAAFTAADRETPAAPGSVLFVGSSTIRLWQTLAEDFPAVPVVNRGFGGCELRDVVHYFDELVLPSRPRLVVLYAGENDLANGATPEQVAQAFSEFQSKLRKARPGTPLVFLAIKPSPSRTRIKEAVRQANALIAPRCAADPACRFVDAQARLLNANGEPDPKYFVQDGVHLNREGYALWVEMLTPHLRPAGVPRK